ncbi:hypothetical protein J1N35_022888 [Gossypium stocksii]|uniref:Uncharacterized protein n=1 Tax=Gossypium stocksii TaxID=47602 RepID=A0A9D3VIP9_9ROSI|nr:hypothetical protein J1N35_022888 [Gossypium stocksii]
MDPSRYLDADGSEVGLFSKSEPIPTKLEDGEGGDEDEEDPQFMSYSPLAHMHNVNLSIDNALELANLPHRRPGHRSTSLDSGDLEVGREFSSKDGFLAVLKRYNVKNGVNFHIVKSKLEKFKDVSRDHPKLDSDMVASIILSMVKVDPRTTVSILIANIRSQFNYMPLYRKAWIAK